MLVVGFLGSLFLVYHAGLSASYDCRNGRGDSCYEPQHRDREHIGREHITSRRNKIDLTGHFLPVEKDRDIVVNRAIIKEKREQEDESFTEKRTRRAERIPLVDRQKRNLRLHDKLFLGKKFDRKSLAANTKQPVTLSEDIRKHEVRNVYIQLKEADSPRAGDFECTATIVPSCCAFSVGDTHEAKRICEGFSKLCKGFVMSTISSKHDTFEYVMYLKRELNGTMANYLTDFFVKVDYLDELKWNEDKS